MKRRTGKLGQFDVLVDGEVIASRRGTVPTKLVGGWPDPEAVVHRIEELQLARQKV